MSVVTMELCDDLDSPAALSVGDDLLAVGGWEEALPVVVPVVLHRVVRDVRVPLGTTHV